MNKKLSAYISLIVFVLCTLASPIFYNWYKTTFALSENQILIPFVTMSVAWIGGLFLIAVKFQKAYED